MSRNIIVKKPGVKKTVYIDLRFRENRKYATIRLMNKVTIICGVYTDNKNNWHCYLGRKGGSLVPISECSAKEIAEQLLGGELDSLKSQ